MTPSNFSTHTFYLIALSISLTWLSCSSNPNDQKEKLTDSHLGKISHHATGSEKALPYFEKGLLLLHSFEYEDARAEFKKAQEQDTTMVMAYWGEAMTYNHTLWSSQYYDDARSALEKLGNTKEERLAKANTEIERELLEGAEVLFGEGEKFTRDSAYSKHMRSLHEKYPESHEVASLYALSLLGSVPSRDEEIYGKAAKIVEGILAENPQHPGALHYLIHSYDDPDHAHLAVHAADKYSKVAPDAGHALHMPSHIYIALGRWDDVISSNIASYEASLKRMEEKDLGHNARNLHALHWLMYAHLQKGEFEEASVILEDMKSFYRDTITPRIAGYMIHMQANYMVETEDWDSEDIVDVDISDLNISLSSIHRFTKGMAAYQNKNVDNLKDIIDSMEYTRQEAEKDRLLSGAKMCSGVSWVNQKASRQDIQNATTMELQLKSLLAKLEGRSSETEMFLIKAVEMEDSTPHMFGPPTVVKPSHEMYAEWLMQQGRSEEAVKQYEASLERAPGRRLSTVSGTSI
ncbi:MAG: hypothetical protein R3275_07155 [Saprospiraceae bacterium]|nr:hypothetical protein [Saprospiraceae bacterium]